MPKYIIISPVRNEEKLIKTTLDTVVNQTLTPYLWIIVNDGSTDNTEAIVDEYMAKHPWIRKLNLDDRGYYFPGTGVVNVFNQGFELIKDEEWDYVVKLDTDLKFDDDYFEVLLNRMESNPKFGLCSGCTYVPSGNGLIKEMAQADHPVGPCKVYKRKCWEDIGGMLPVPGWDLADLLAAQMHGYETVCYFDLKIIHYRPTGIRRKGIWAPKFLQGRFAYRHGYAFWYLFLKELSHIHKRPVVIGFLAQLSGFTYAAIVRDEPLFPRDMRLYLRKRHRRIFIKKFFNPGK